MKYKKSKLNLLMWLISSFLTVIYCIGITVLLTNYNVSLFFLVVLIVGALAHGAGAYLYFTIYYGKRNYITVFSDTLQIDKGLIRQPLTIKINSIENMEIIGEKIRIKTYNTSKEKSIHLNCLSLEDIIELKEILNV